MAELIYRFPPGNLHIADLPYRLSSWAFDDPKNVGLWLDAEGQMQGWAVLQTPFWTIDCAVHPEADKSLYPQIVAWADQRALQALDTPSGRLAWFVNVFPDQDDHIRHLEAAGFACQADVGEASWSRVFMRRPAQEPIADYALPPGFSIRPLAGEGEVEDYVALHRAVFESRNMTVEWRARTLQCLDYHPDVDLVVVSPEGGLAAFCIGWLNHSAEGACGQVEPLGVHVDFRKLGLGRAILLEMLCRFNNRGAGKIYVETDKQRDAALELYDSVGFRVIQDVLVYRKDYGNH